MPARRPDPEPLETNDVLIVACGTVLWTVGLVVVVILDLAGAGIHTWWIWMCAAGMALGLLGVRFCRRRTAAIARDRAAVTGQPS